MTVQTSRATQAPRRLCGSASTVLTSGTGGLAWMAPDSRGTAASGWMFVLPLALGLVMLGT